MQGETKAAEAKAKMAKISGRAREAAKVMAREIKMMTGVEVVAVVAAEGRATDQQRTAGRCLRRSAESQRLQPDSVTGPVLAPGAAVRLHLRNAEAVTLGGPHRDLSQRSRLLGVPSRSGAGAEMASRRRLASRLADRGGSEAAVIMLLSEAEVVVGGEKRLAPGLPRRTGKTKPRSDGSAEE